MKLHEFLIAFFKTLIAKLTTPSKAELPPPKPVIVPPVVVPPVKEPVKPVETPKPVTPPIVVVPKPMPANRILGVDVSHYEPAVNWELAKAGGVRFMWTKATEGLKFVDRELKSHTDAAKAAGVHTGAYHFFRASQSAEDQAHHYLSTVRDMKFDLPHCLDWESSSADGEPAKVQMVRAKQWLDIVEKATGQVPIIYGGESHLIELQLGEEFKKYPLWLAHYHTTEARLKIPKPWDKITIWQYSESERVPGLSPGHTVDANWFFGTEDDFKKLLV